MSSTNKNQDLLDTAIEAGKLKSVIIALENGANPNAKTFAHKSGGFKGNALHRLAYAEGPESLFFKNPPYYVNNTVDCFKIPQENYNQIAKVLFQHGANIHELDSAFLQNPLLAAIGFGNTRAALAIINLCELLSNEEAYKLLNARPKDQNFDTTPLIMSIQRNDMPVFLKLINNQNININLCDRYGLTPLHWSVIMGLPEMTYELLSKGANPHLKTYSIIKDKKNPDLYIKGGLKPIDYIEINKDDLKAPPNHSKFLQRGEFRPILSHFDNIDAFYKIRSQLIQNNHTIIKDILEQSMIASDLFATRPKQHFTKFEQNKKQKKIYTKDKLRSIIFKYQHGIQNLIHILNDFRELEDDDSYKDEIQAIINFATQSRNKLGTTFIPPLKNAKEYELEKIFNDLITAISQDKKELEKLIKQAVNSEFLTKRQYDKIIPTLK